MKKAFSLVEMLVVVGIIAVLVGFTIPAINALQKSYDSTGADSMISAALATARTLAISNHNYVGVRFQKACKSTDNVIKAAQYMIFIKYEEPKNMGNVTDAFCAIEGYKPIKLPENIGVMDMTTINSDAIINNDPNILDATAFSIIFSPAGKLVIHLVQTRYFNNTPDDVINIQTVVDAGNAMFVEDSTSKNESSRNNFVIYDCGKFSQLNPATRYLTYLKDLKKTYVNPYTGQLIEK